MTQPEAHSVDSPHQIAVPPITGNPNAIAARVRNITLRQPGAVSDWNFGARAVSGENLIVASPLPRASGAFVADDAVSVLVVVSFHFSIANSGRSHPPAPFGMIAARYCVTYFLEKSAEQPSADDLDAFARANGPYSIYPFWREFVSSSLARAGLPLLPMPVVRPGQFFAIPLDPQTLAAFTSEADHMRQVGERPAQG